VEGEWMMAQGADLSAQILKVSHHGSKFGTGTKLLDASKPEVALVSCGAATPVSQRGRCVPDRSQWDDHGHYRRQHLPGRDGSVGTLSTNV
jgi:hypothetical protein